LIDDTFSNPNTTAAATASFGLLGAVVATTLTERGYLIDMETFRVRQVTYRNLKAIFYDYPDIFKRYKKIENPTFEVTIDFINEINKREREKALAKQ
jgi:hypothetical protein